MESSAHPAPVTIAVFDHVMEAEIARGRLEAEGIRAFVQDENLVVQNWLYRNAIGGLQLQVASEEADGAMEILNSMKFDDEGVDPDRTSLHDIETCPSCDSDQLDYVRSERRAAHLSWLLVGFPLLASPRRTRCLTCGHTWSSTSAALLRLWTFLLLIFGLLAAWAGWEYRSLWFGVIGVFFVLGSIRIMKTPLKESDVSSSRI